MASLVSPSDAATSAGAARSCGSSPGSSLAFLARSARVTPSLRAPKGRKFFGAAGGRRGGRGRHGKRGCWGARVDILRPALAVGAHGRGCQRHALLLRRHPTPRLGLVPRRVLRAHFHLLLLAGECARAPRVPRRPSLSILSRVPRRLPHWMRTALGTLDAVQPVAGCRRLPREGAVTFSLSFHSYYTVDRAHSLPPLSRPRPSPKPLLRGNSSFDSNSLPVQGRRAALAGRPRTKLTACSGSPGGVTGTGECAISNLSSVTECFQHSL